MALFGPPNVAKLEARGSIDGLVKAARYKKDPAVAEPPRKTALEGFLDKIVQRLQTKNMVQLNTSREALVIIGPPARDRLIFILRNGHVHRRQDAAYVLGMMQDPEAVPRAHASRCTTPTLCCACCASRRWARSATRSASSTLRLAHGRRGRRPSPPRRASRSRRWERSRRRSEACGRARVPAG